MQASSLQKRRVTGAHAFFLGAFLALLALTPAILPYGGRFVTRGDFIEQQLPFILETRRILRSGLTSYSFNTFLGAPAVGSYAFYTLGSVFVWPLALLPKTLIPFGISVMAVLKHAVCALTSFCLCCGGWSKRSGSRCWAACSIPFRRSPSSTRSFITFWKSSRFSL